MKDEIKTIKEVYQNKEYLILALSSTIVFYIVNVILHNYQTLFSLSKNPFIFFNLLVTMGLSFHQTVSQKTYISILILSTLFGLLLSLLVFKAKLNLSSSSKKPHVFASIGILLAILVPGCAACGVGILPLLGVSLGVLSFLPLKGFEISLIAIFIMAYSIVNVTKKMYVCDIARY